MIFIKTGDVATIHGDAASPQPFAYQFSCKTSESVRWLADRGALTAKTERCKCKDWERRSQFVAFLYESPLFNDTVGQLGQLLETVHM